MNEELKKLEKKSSLKEDDLRKIEELLKEADKKYREGKEIISDKEFDNFLSRYIALCEKHNITPKTSFVDIDSKKVTHVTQGFLGTLEKANTIEELMMGWRRETYLELGDSLFDVVVELKYDGNSVSIVYNNKGLAIAAFSRGKEGTGQNLMKVFEGHRIPEEICKNYEKVEVRYEAVMTNENFERMLQNEDVRDFANNRSAVSGLLSKNDTSLAKKYLSLAMLDINLDGEMPERFEQYEIFEQIAKEDFRINSKMKIRILCENNSFYQYKGFFKIENILNKKVFQDKITKLYEDFNNGKRFAYNVMVDGLVIKIVRKDYVKQLGYNKDVPKWAVALKFNYLEKESIVKDIHLYMGKTARLTPVVEFEPVEFFGAVQTRVSLSNYKRFCELNLSKGDKILITYRNDVISYVERVVKKSKNKPIEIDPTCPICGSDLFVNETETFLFCDNPECKGKKLGKMEKFCVSTGMKGIRYNILERLFNENIFMDISDFYNKENRSKLKKAKLDNFGEKSVNNILNILDSAKNIYDYQLIGSLSIENVGKSRCKDLFKIYTLDDIMNDKLKKPKSFITEVTNIEGFSDILANSLVLGLQENKDLILYLQKELLVKNYKDDFKVDKNSKSLTFVITGELNTMSRTEAKNVLELRGHKVTGSVTSKTDYLVTNDTSSGTVKNKKAVELGVPIINEEELLKFISK